MKSDKMCKCCHVLADCHSYDGAKEGADPNGKESSSMPREKQVSREKASVHRGKNTGRCSFESL